MNLKERNQARRLLLAVGRVPTGVIVSHGRMVGLSTDGDGRRCAFGTPMQFWTLDQVLEYCDTHTPIGGTTEE